MTSPQAIRNIANDIYYLAVHRRKGEIVREYGGLGGAGTLNAPDRASSVEEDLRFIYAEFERFTTPNSTSPLLNMRDLLRSAIGHVGSGDASYLGSESSLELSDWSGDAKISFTDNYITKWETYRSNHIIILDLLLASISALIELYEKMWKKAEEIGDAANTALGDLDTWLPLWLQSEEGADLFIKIAGIVTNTMLAPSGLATFAVATIGIADLGRSAENASGAIFGKTVMGILEAMKKELDKLEEETLGEQDKILKALRDACWKIDDNIVDTLPSAPRLRGVDPENPGSDLVYRP